VHHHDGTDVRHIADSNYRGNTPSLRITVLCSASFTAHPAPGPEQLRAFWALLTATPSHRGRVSMLRHCFPLLLLLAACSLVATATALPTAAAGASASTAGAKPQAEDSVGKHGLTAKQAVKVAIAALETVNAADVIAGALAAEGRPGMRNAQHVSTGPLPGPTLLPVPAPSVAQPSRNTMGMSVQKYRSSKVGESVNSSMRQPVAGTSQHTLSAAQQLILS
jgi:hypothetical protein